MKIRLSKEAKFLKTSLISTLTVSKVERKYFACGLRELVLSEKLQRSILVWFNLFDWLRGWRFVLIIVLYTDIARLWLTFGVKGKEKNWKRKCSVSIFIFTSQPFNGNSHSFFFLKCSLIIIRLFSSLSKRKVSISVWSGIVSYRLFLTYTLHDWW